MERKTLDDTELERALALIEKGHQLEGQQPSAEALDRARRILSGTLSSEDAEIELAEAIRQIRNKEST